MPSASFGAGAGRRGDEPHRPAPPLLAAAAVSKPATLRRHFLQFTSAAPGRRSPFSYLVMRPPAAAAGRTSPRPDTRAHRRFVRRPVAGDSAFTEKDRSMPELSTRPARRRCLTSWLVPAAVLFCLRAVLPSHAAEQTP